MTTAWLDLARNAPIGQEFELVVLNDLEFQLTLQTKLTPPPKPKVTAPAPAAAKPSGHKKSNSAFGRLLTSPKKRKELERKQQEEAERAAVAAQKAQEEREAARRAKANPTAWDMLHDLVATDGSFARAYVCLKNHERQAYGRPFTIDIPCFNEWALEDAEIASSVKSKRGGPVRRPPYKVGKLTLQLLYVPKPKGATDDDMPKSMNACIREMKEAEESKGRIWEGHLSQQGGDCPVSISPYLSPYLHVLARIGDILIRLYSTGAAASSASLAQSSPLIMRPPVSLVLPLISPKRPSSSMTVQRWSTTKLAVVASQASPRKTRVTLLLKRAFASVLATVRPSTSTQIVQSKRMVGCKCFPKWSERPPCPVLQRPGPSWCSRKRRRRGPLCVLKLSKLVHLSRMAKTPSSIPHVQACTNGEPRKARRIARRGITVAVKSPRHPWTRARATRPTHGAVKSSP